MVARRHWLIALACFVTVDIVCGAVTEEQMAKAGAALRQACMGKTKAPLESVELIAVGKAPNDKPSKCYIQCIMEMSNGMKKAKITAEAFYKQVDMLMPVDYAQATKTTFAACTDSANGIKDACEAGYALYNCLKTQYGEGFAYV